MSVSKAHIISTAPLDPRDAKWIKTSSIIYVDPTGRERKWESVDRTTKPATSDVDAVGIVAQLDDPSTPDAPPRVLLQRQFRPPTGRVTVEFPAGLVDPSESISETALRELREETGYHGEIDTRGAGVGLPMWNDPGMAATTVRMVHVRVDMTRPENQEPKPALEDGEFIECFSVEVGALMQSCREWQAEGLAIDARVGGLAEGIEMAKRWNL